MPNILGLLEMLALILFLFLKFVFVFLVESFYRERYIQKSKEQEQLRKKLQSQAEQEIEELSNQKRTLERKVGPLLLSLAEYPLILSQLGQRPCRLIIRRYSARFRRIILKYLLVRKMQTITSAKILL